MNATPNPVIEIHWGGRVFTFQTEEEARKAGFDLKPVHPSENLPLSAHQTTPS